MGGIFDRNKGCKIKIEQIDDKMNNQEEKSEN